MLFVFSNVFLTCVFSQASRSNTVLSKMKRALCADVAAFADIAEPLQSGRPSNARIEAIRQFLIGAYTLNKHVDGAFLAELCWHITRVGGEGVQDLAINPKDGNASSHGNRLIKHILAKEFKDPQLTNIDVPVFNKKACQRDKVSTPMHLPSAIFEDQTGIFTDSNALDTVEPKELQDKYRCQAWVDHPVKVQSTCHWSRIIPVSLYWDAAQYTIRDSYFGMFIRNLRTGDQELIFIISCMLTNSKAL